MEKLERVTPKNVNEALAMLLLYCFHHLYDKPFHHTPLLAFQLLIPATLALLVERRLDPKKIFTLYMYVCML